jgi:hypothetical protein
MLSLLLTTPRQSRGRAVPFLAMHRAFLGMSRPRRAMRRVSCPETSQVEVEVEVEVGVTVAASQDWRYEGGLEPKRIRRSSSISAVTPSLGSKNEAKRSANAVIVRLGFTPRLPGTTLPSHT